MALSDLQQKVWNEAKSAGYSDEDAAVAVAVASSEGLGSSHYADPNHPQNFGDQGHSVGNFQFYFGGGAGDTWAVQTGHTKEQLAVDPFLGDQWWLQGSLGSALAQGKSLGLKGADLAKFAGGMAEKPFGWDSPGGGLSQAYFKNYNEIFGAGDPATQTIDGPGPSLPLANNEPNVYDPTTGKFTAGSGLPVLDVPAEPVFDAWWQPGSGTQPAPNVTKPTGATDPNQRAIADAIAGQAQATQQVAESNKGVAQAILTALAPLIDIAKFFLNIFNPGSSPWRGLEILFWKLIATLILGFLLVVGLLRLTGTEGIAKNAAIAAAA